MQTDSALLALDIGTTHCKAALFGLDGALLASAARPAPARPMLGGSLGYEPHELWQNAAQALSEVMHSTPARQVRPAALGVTGMAETGLLLDRRSGEAQTPFLAWHDRSALLQAQRLASDPEENERFLRRGIRPTFKCGIAKLLWLAEQGIRPGPESVWLSAADFMVYRLTGSLATDPTLALRTYAYDLDARAWDAAWLASLGLSPQHFPALLPSGKPAGAVSARAAEQTGLPAGMPAAVCGHDHVCGAAAVAAVEPGQIFSSIGTAESLMGVIEDRPLGPAERAAGFSYGVHVVQGRRYWMGGLSASGGSIEWLRGLLGEQRLSYAEIDALLDLAPAGPTGILYFPYISGSGSPHIDPRVRGAFVGLDAGHGRAHLAKAVLEGTAYEIEFIRRAAAQAFGLPIATLITAGGGTRSARWMQIKADVTGCKIETRLMPETSLLGAALLSGAGSGVYPSIHSALASQALSAAQVYTPDPSRHSAYSQLFEQGYLPLQTPLRGLNSRLGERGQPLGGPRE